MTRFTRCFIIKAVVAAFLIFLIGIFRLSLTLDSLDHQKSFRHLGEEDNSKTDCGYRINMIIQQHNHEIEMLQDQILELQRLVSINRNNNSVTAHSAKLSPSCLEQIQFSSKILKTDAVRGRSYISERHIPIFNKFDMWNQYRAGSGYGLEAKDKLNGLQRLHVDEVIDEAVSFINSSKWRRDHFVDGIYQNSPSIGTHYELTFVNDSNDRQRVTLFRPEAPAVPIHHKLITSDEKLNIIIPLSERTQALVLFLRNFESLLVKMKSQIFLTIVYFGSSTKELAYAFQPFIAKHRYRSYHIEHISNRNFSRGYALEAGIKSWKGTADPLMFLCDVDVVFNQDFIDRCLTYPERQSRIYYPIVFSTYNPQIIELYFNQKFPKLSDKLKVTSDHGFWRHFGYGMACLYRSDYLKSGGFNVDLKEWGEEDVLLFRAFTQSNLTVIRAPDPGIFHLWHHKHCDQGLSDEHYRACIRSKTYNEGSHIQLGYMVLKEEINQWRKERHHL